MDVGILLEFHVITNSKISMQGIAAKCAEQVCVDTCLMTALYLTSQNNLRVHSFSLYACQANNTSQQGCLPHQILFLLQVIQQL